MADGVGVFPRIPDPMDLGDDPMDPRRSMRSGNLQAKPAPLDPRRCSAHNRAGDRCARWSVTGGTVCVMHGGGRQRKRLQQERVLDGTLLLATGMADVCSRRDGSTYLRRRAGVARQFDVSADMAARKDGERASMVRVVLALMEGKSGPEAVQEAGIQPSTLATWLHDPRFRLALQVAADEREAV